MNLSNTGPGNGNSLQGSISDDGKFVAFASDATNITATDLTITRDVFLRDLETNTTQLISLATTLTQGGNAASQDPSVSATGQYVAFVSAATNLTSVALGPGQNVYLHNTEGNVVTLVSTGDTPGTGGAADVGLGAPTVSDNGRFVAFSSSASNLVTGDINGVSDVFRKDVIGGTVVVASQSTAGVFGNGASSRPVINADGAFIAFSSVATNLAAPDSNIGPDVFLRDLNALTTTLVSVNTAGTAGTGSSSQPAINDQGTVVAFASSSTELVTEDIDNLDIFVAAAPIPQNDLTRPSVRIPPQPTAPLAPIVGDVVLPFTIIYDDNNSIDTATLGDNDVIVTGPNGFSAPATFFDLTSTTGRSATVRYTVPAPGGTLSSLDNGTYTVTVQGEQIADNSRNFIPAGQAVTFTLDLPPSEVVLPQPTYIGGSPAIGSATYEFTVIYSERGGINFASFGNDDIQVTGPKNFTQNATVVSTTPLNETQSSVVYRITAPGGTWDATDAGPYSVKILPGGVRDVAGNAVQAGEIATFTALGADLIAIPLRNLRLGAISGIDQQRARVRILNQGTVATTVPIAVTLYTSLDETLDPGDATIGTFVSNRPIAPDDFVQISVHFTYPQVAEGNYFVLSQVDSGNAVIEQSETNNIDASFKKVGLSAPFADLVPTLIPFTGNRSRLGTNEAFIKLRNAGNVSASGDITVALTAISDVTPEPTERVVANLPIKINLRPGQRRTFRLPFAFALEFERGTYRLVATVDSTNVIPERDEINNRVVSFSSFTFA